MFRIQSNIKNYILKIYDNKMNLLLSFNVNNFQQDIYNIEYGGYFVEICQKNNILLKKFIIYKFDKYIYYLYVDKLYRKIIFKLIDQNYYGLYIEKGMIKLWL